MLAAACSDVLSLATSRARSELAVLVLQGSAPAPAGAQFMLRNNAPLTRNFSHPDNALTPYLRLTFPSGSTATVGGAAAGANDSVLVTVQHVAGTYGFTLSTSPAATFSSGNAPSATFFFGTYGDFTGSRAGSRYTTNNEFAQALGLWREESFDRFSEVPGSGPAGTDGVAGSLQGSGSYLAAAPK